MKLELTSGTKDRGEKLRISIHSVELIDIDNMLEKFCGEVKLWLKPDTHSGSYLTLYFPIMEKLDKPNHSINMHLFSVHDKDPQIFAKMGRRAKRLGWKVKECPSRD